MVMETAKLYQNARAFQVAHQTNLDSSSPTPLEKLGVVRYTHDSIFGLRGFKYVRFDQAGGVTKGQLQSKIANIDVANILSGTTTSITTAGLTANILVGGILVCIDDAGAAGAAPEGESALIVENTTSVITIHENDAFSVAPAVNDDFKVILPWAVVDSVDGNAAGIVQGVVMADQDQYDYGWVQFLGINNDVDAIAAGTALVLDESVVAGAALVNDGAADAVDLRIGRLLVGLSSDTVRRKAVVDLFCGEAFKMGLSAA
jgi:hypothetical protein